MEWDSFCLADTAAHLLNDEQLRKAHLGQSVVRGIVIKSTMGTRRSMSP